MFDQAFEKLEPQITEHIHDLRSQGHTYADMLKALSDRHEWTESWMFTKEEFNYEHARFTMTQLCNAVELLTGSDLAFADGMRERIVGLVEYEASVHKREQQECLHYEHIKALEEGAA